MHIWPKIAHICVFMLWHLMASKDLKATPMLEHTPFEFGFAKIPHFNDSNFSRFQIENERESIRNFCNKLRAEFLKYKWKEDPCGKVKWQSKFRTKEGYPLIYAKFGRGNSTLFLGGVHPDEITPIHLAFRFARYVDANPEIYIKNNINIIVAPIVNPDGFFLQKPSRTNANKIDLNRNFQTSDWYTKSIKTWAHRKRGLVRYFPGYFPNTEIETFFQGYLVDQFLPDKIFTVHAPLGFLDYDGPGDRKPKLLSRTEMKAKQFVYSVAKKSRNYKIVDYSFYPGSLGNFAGNERGVPTVTLELETTQPDKVDQYWEKFLPGFIQSVEYKFQKNSD